MRVYCRTPLSTCLARTYKSPSALALFQSRGCDSTTLTYSRMAASTLPSFKAFSAAFNAASRSNGGTLKALSQSYQTGSQVGMNAGAAVNSQIVQPPKGDRRSRTPYVGRTHNGGQR